MNEHREYNPLDYENLTKNCVLELMQRGPFTLPLTERFGGAGVYALFYTGAFEAYEAIRSPDASRPIYVGKAEPAGGRTGIMRQRQSRALFARIAQHTGSIDDAQNLRIGDFLCRFLVVTPLWITMAERFLIEHYRPVWNLCLDGFGIHDPGRGRHQGEISWWDSIHPGRAFAANLRQTRTSDQAAARLHDCMEELEHIPAGRMREIAEREAESEH